MDYVIEEAINSTISAYDNTIFAMLKKYGIDVDKLEEIKERVAISEDFLEREKHFYIDGAYCFTLRTNTEIVESQETFKLKTTISSHLVVGAYDNNKI